MVTRSVFGFKNKLTVHAPVLLLIPAALWAGAITPILTQVERSAFTGVPRYSSDPFSSGIQTAVTTIYGPINTTTNRWGSFSFYPACMAPFCDPELALRLRLIVN